MTRRTLTAALLLCAALVLALAACGGGDDDGGDGGGGGGGAAEETTETGGGGGGGETLELAADPGGALSFDTSELQASAGEVTINLTNDASIPHNVAVEGGGVDEASPVVTGDSTSLTVELEAGEYTFYCAVGNHREAGMEGTLVVE